MHSHALLACLVLTGLAQTAAADPPASAPPAGQQGAQPATNPTAQPDAAAKPSTPDASQAPATATAATQQPAASATSTATGAKAAPAIDPKTGKPELTADERRLIAMGYKMVTRNGENYFCHQEDELGSRLASKKTCGTVQQLKFVIQQNQDAVRDMQGYRKMESNH